MTRRNVHKSGQTMVEYIIIVVIVAIAAIAIYFGLFAPAVVPVRVLEYILILGALAYFVCDFFLRRP